MVKLKIFMISAELCTLPYLMANHSAIFNFQSLLSVILLLICTCAYVRALAPSLLDKNKTGFLGIFWKCARIGERKSPYVACCCIIMALTILFSDSGQRLGKEDNEVHHKHKPTTTIEDGNVIENSVHLRFGRQLRSQSAVDKKPRWTRSPRKTASDQTKGSRVHNVQLVISPLAEVSRNLVDQIPPLTSN
ncbi:hypothetical protein JZ751_011691 [Albula glossodonta]|uniref:Protein kish-A n=1 Tax=Albula glossodonta TaxID=121402 RepID=A0A8T2PQC0_9TELE|nr:hypothetical protein JZ751_011691 [Albula glossodonta]